MYWNFKEGIMDRDKLLKIAYNTMECRKAHLNREKGFIFYHGERTANLALNLRKKIFPGEPSKDDIIYAAALFHDIGKGIGHHNETGGVLAKEFLENEMPMQDLETVCSIIRLHNKRKLTDNYSMEIKIVQDADLLDHLGTIEVWLHFFYYANQGGNVKDSIEYWTGQEFKENRKIQRELLNYNLSKQIFDEKIKFEDDFIKRFYKEANGDI